MTSCPHMNFQARVTVNRLEDVGRFTADVMIVCADCAEPFQFLGLKPGVSSSGAYCSMDGLEARLAILPNSQVMSPGARIMANAKGGEC